MNNEASTKVFIEGAELVSENAGDGINRAVIAYDDRLMLVKVSFEQGSIGALHQHPHSQICYIEKGIFEVNIDDQKRILRQGDSFYVAPGLLHGVHCLEAGVLIDMFSPMREDFIR